MSTLTIRRLDDSVKTRLRVRAAQRGHSMEEEAREILKAALGVEKVAQPNLYEAIRKRLAPIGGFDLPVVKRKPMREPPTFDD